LEGLEISEVLLSDLEYSGRLDAEYYRPEFLSNEGLLRARNGRPLSSLSDFLIGPFGSAFTVENYTEDKSYRYIRGKDVKQMCLMDDDNVYMPKVDFERLSKYALRENDILVSVVGTLGNAAIVEEEHTPAIFSCKCTVLRTYGIRSHYLLAYLNSKYGRSLLLRKERGAIQKGLNLDDLKTLDVYVAGKELQEAIEQLYYESIEKKKCSKSTYAQAEALLLNTLCMAGFSPSTEGINIKSFKESFAATGRLDAEAYQPKYDQLRDILENYSGGVTSIDELAGQIANGAEVREYQEKGVVYLRVGDLKNLTIDASSVVRIDPISAEKGLEKIDLQIGDVLVSRSGSLAVTAVVEPEWKDALISSHLIRLRITDARINPYYLALFLGAVPGKMQIQQRSNGGVQPEISQPALKSIVVPILPQSVQQEISHLILSARKLRDLSNDLLTVAKRAVEIAIEQDENAGITYIKANS
jgi:restriction endonuclease S subunit